MITIKEILKKYFDYDSFRPGQEEIINSICSGNDTFAIMPTGGGKSICYQIPAVYLKGTTIVISPLISLMKDQVDTLLSKNINAAYINSSLSNEELNLTIHKLKSGELKLLYLAPERIENNQFLENIKDVEVPLIAIDEAHCISEWGHDFRPSYRKVKLLKDFFPGSITSAFTATATNDVKHDIIKSLNLKNPNIYLKGFDRQNLSYIVKNSKNKLEDVYKEVKNINGSAIIYAGSRRRVEEFYNYLKDKISGVTYYHAGLNENYRKIQQDKFLSNKSNIIIATNAFGMGIDKPDVRKVIHVDLTSTIESYYQEAGRAGRDGLESECILFYNDKDRGLQDYFINMTYPIYDEILKIYNFLYDETKTKIGEESKIAYYGNENEIAFKLKLQLYKVQNILSLFERNGILSSGKATNWAYIKVNPNMERVKEYFNHTKQENKVILEAFLRSVNASETAKHTIIYFDELIRKYNINKEHLENAINSFQYNEIIDFRGYRPKESITLLLPRYHNNSIPINFEDLIKRKNLAIEKLNIVEEFANTNQCKRNFILNYFGESISTNCNKCSSCNSKSVINSDVKTYISSKIKELFEETRNTYSKAISWKILNGSKSQDIYLNNFHNLSTYSSLNDIKKKDFEIVWNELSSSPNIKKTINPKIISNDIIMLVNSKNSLSEILNKTKIKKADLYDILISNKSILSIDSLFYDLDFNSIKEYIINSKPSIRDLQIYCNNKLDFIDSKFLIEFYS